MTTDSTTTVQPPVPASTAVPASTEAQVAKPPEPQKPAQPVLVDPTVLKQMIDEAVIKGRDAGKRELQSAQDRNKASGTKVQRVAKAGQDALSEVVTQLKATDPEVAKAIELAQLRAEKRASQMTEEEETVAQQQAEFHRQFQESLSGTMKVMGVDPNDPAIDWANDAPNYIEAQKRILTSATKIQEAHIKATTSGFEQRLKDMEKELKALKGEANSVETSTSPGVVAGSDAEFVKKFAAGELPLNKVNKERYEKIVENYS